MRMTPAAKIKQGKIHSSIVRSKGRIDLPGDCGHFRLGQRVYFHLGATGEVIFGGEPKRAHRGRLLSSRVRRGLRAIAKYGPRAKREVVRG